ncbi:DUF2865 domain-containing protein [Bradyrhizobium sp.]|uniref:DUF2865 domain-containing protein n=1 Tax=Bradyrhizobium sp. TaxID=376 RepID=UPI0025B83335|nr:DUF2865 domain-containing protein [Bradyrhizobium sp.]
MQTLSGKPAAWAAAALALACALAPAAQAQDFFSQLFGGFDGPHVRQPYISMPYARDDRSVSVPRAEPRPRYAGGSQAFCVRTCDGRFFPVNGSDNASRVASCKSFCPASETRVFYGSSIDSAAAQNGKTYSDMPNAFRFREEIVSGCTCNGKDQIGLAPVKIENDPTLRKGDIVAGENGLLVAGRSGDRRGAGLNFSPASERVRAQYDRVRIVARSDSSQN